MCHHAGDGSGKGNKASIGVEICINEDQDYVKQVQNGAKVIAYLMKLHKLPISRVVRHFDWSGKHCPSQITDVWYGFTWAKFKQMVVDYYNAGTTTVKPVAKTAAKTTTTNGIVKKYSEKGIFYPNDNILVRDKPTTQGEHIATYRAGRGVCGFSYGTHGQSICVVRVLALQWRVRIHSVQKIQRWQ